MTAAGQQSPKWKAPEPFTGDVTADAPGKCPSCSWVMRGDGKWWLKYASALCAEHGAVR